MKTSKKESKHQIDELRDQKTAAEKEANKYKEAYTNIQKELTKCKDEVQSEQR